MKNKYEWQTYEEAARQLLIDVKEYLGINKVEGKKKIKGQNSGTKWEVDVTPYNAKEGKIILVECKHYLKHAINQDTMAGFAYKIEDTGAAGGIIITTLGLQEGAQKIADAEKILTIKLDYNSTSDNYIAQIGKKIFGKVTDKISFEECLEVYDAKGNLIYKD